MSPPSLEPLGSDTICYRTQDLTGKIDQQISKHNITAHQAFCDITFIASSFHTELGPVVYGPSNFGWGSSSQDQVGHFPINAV